MIIIKFIAYDVFHTILLRVRSIRSKTNRWKVIRVCDHIHNFFFYFLRFQFSIIFLSVNWFGIWIWFEFGYHAYFLGLYLVFCLIIFLSLWGFFLSCVMTKVTLDTSVFHISPFSCAVVGVALVVYSWDCILPFLFFSLSWFRMG